MSKELLLSIISELYEAGFPVVAVVCDMGTKNISLYNSLGITPGEY